jgi:DNA-binding response OmpR family regulator
MFTIRGKNILIVDDKSDITFTIKNILEDNGFKVDSFTDSISALDNYQINFYDLIILDIKMPKMDGFQLYTKIREKDPKVKICFLTASELYYEKFRKTRSELGKKIGEDYFIQKPINTEDLIKHLTKIMNKNEHGQNMLLT